MAGESKHVTPEEADSRVWELIDSIRICMFVTWDGERQRARPLAAVPKRDRHAIYFLSDADSVKDEQVKRFPIVTLAFADTKANKYVSMSGHAKVINDRAMIKEIWSPLNKAWWDSADDPDIRLIVVSPDDAEYWDSSNRFVATLAMLSAAATGAKPSLGDNEKLKM